jgi:hypothetical protein
MKDLGWWMGGWGFGLVLVVGFAVQKKKIVEK